MFLGFDILPVLTPQAAYLGFFKEERKVSILINHLLLLFKLYIYKSRDIGTLSLNNFIKEVQKVYYVEKHLVDLNRGKKKYFDKKWNTIKNKMVNV